MTSSRIFLCACLVGGTVLAVVAQQPGRIGLEYSRAGEALKKKDYRAAVEHLRRAVAEAPSHPALIAELARAQYLAGDGEAARASMMRALRLGSGLDVVDDPVVAPMLAGDEAGAVRKAVTALRERHSTSLEAFRLRQRDLIPEGMAYDPIDKVFYVGSIYRRKILRVDPAGRVTDFVGEKQDGLLAVLGMKVDSTRRTLWVATEGTLDMVDARQADIGRSALLQYDLRSGRLLKKLEMGRDPGPHLFNDVALDPEGGVFVTDSEDGSVWRLRPAAERLERLAGPRAFEYPNGIAMASDGRRLFVAHLAGVAVIDPQTGRSTPLSHPDTVTVAGIDGLYREGHRLVAVQNGLTPARVAVFDMNEAEDRVTALRVLERGHPLFDSIPTTGAVAEGWFYYIANAQLRAFTPDHRILPAEKLQESVILKTRLPTS